MPFMPECFAESVDPGGAYNDLNFIASPTVTSTATTVTVPALNELLYYIPALPMDYDSVGRFDAPSLLRLTRLYFEAQGNRAGDADARINASNPGFFYNPSGGGPLVSTEQLSCAVNYNTTSAQLASVVVGFGTVDPITPDPTTSFTLQATGGAAITAAYTW